jgi:membrane glycosyltransferase
MPFSGLIQTSPIVLKNKKLYNNIQNFSGRSEMAPLINTINNKSG